eukprot:CAMPEP_0179475232 /NCGR_PEP_ID=MMETSP0799-20121207/54484_1 /TAXON_ID=46947 /ORGANISM="Geminigera cryophila, Strain CCMP2564" /LENGTH=458 /DNA_ID=CAMNT_0021284681 /DNA_START=482 /DNA_END=1855 /DNA_ORIENTATION=-
MNKSIALHRLVASLLKVDYDKDCVDLNIWIDRTTDGLLDEATNSVAQEALWPHGRKVVHIRTSNVGNLVQWIDVWNSSLPGGLHSLTNERLVVFEDQMEVSTQFWKWLKIGHTLFSNRSDIAGFALDTGERVGLQAARRKISDGTNFLSVLVGSQVFSPTAKHWVRFTFWAKKWMVSEELVMPSNNSSDRSGGCRGKNCSWIQLHNKYTSMFQDKYTVYAKFSKGQALATHLLHDSHQILARYPVVPSLFKFSAQSNIAAMHVMQSSKQVSYSTRMVRDTAVMLHANQSCQKELGWVPFMIVNEGFLPLLENWLQLIPKLLLERGHIIIQCTLFVALDDHSMLFISQTRSLPWTSRWRISSSSAANSNAELQYGSRDYFNLMGNRLKLVHEILSHGVRLALIEADQVLLRDPFDMVNALETTQLNDFVTYDDSRNQLSRLPCFGFLFIRPSANSLSVW